MRENWDTSHSRLAEYKVLNRRKSEGTFAQEIDIPIR